MLQLHEIAFFIDTGHAGSVDARGVAMPSLRDHPYSVKGGMSGLAMCALLSIKVARAALFRCRSKACSVGGSSFKRVDLLLRNLYTLSLPRSKSSGWSALDVYTAIVRSRACYRRKTWTYRRHIINTLGIIILQLQSLYVRVSGLTTQTPELGS